jgi:probable rRNA maturation factor
MRPELDVTVEHPGWTATIPALESLVARVIDACLEICPETFDSPTEVSVLFTDARAIRALNAEWRKEDKATNVLSFPAPAGSGPVRMLGDVALSFETVEQEASTEDKTFENHTMHLVAHGFLHLLGFDHETDEDAEEMEACERAALALLGVPDPHGAPVGESR